eukprot:TRINITY_DN3910_c0_g1_i4.p1 TRINITY_DN3910_c0_g1~~TRINITY_DN3910_c0_g1_i4.p1  ORF type:complete len:205 (-),score=-1.82 TRINITY_DN3910_c0_g1_i4:15-629(-)
MVILVGAPDKDEEKKKKKSNLTRNPQKIIFSCNQKQKNIFLPFKRKTARSSLRGFISSLQRLNLTQTNIISQKLMNHTIIFRHIYIKPNKHQTHNKLVIFKQIESKHHLIKPKINLTKNIQIKQSMNMPMKQYLYRQAHISTQTVCVHPHNLTSKKLLQILHNINSQYVLLFFVFFKPMTESPDFGLYLSPGNHVGHHGLQSCQ